MVRPATKGQHHYIFARHKLWIFSLLFVIICVGTAFVKGHLKGGLPVTCSFNSDGGTLSFLPAKGYSLIRIYVKEGDLLAETSNPFSFKIVKKTSGIIKVFYFDLEQRRERYCEFDIGSSLDGIFVVSQFDENRKQVAIQNFVFNP